MTARRNLLSSLPLLFAARNFFSHAAFCLVIAFALVAGHAQNSVAQQIDPDSPSTALSAALAAACRSDQAKFANYLTADSAAAFRALADDERTQFIRRFSLSDAVGKPLLSSDSANHSVLRCETPQFTVEFRFGAARVHENLAFVPVDVMSGQQTQFGLVRENGAWRLLSLGLVLLDVPQLAKEWSAEAAEQEMASKEEAVIAEVYSLRDAIETYRRAFGMLPESLAKLGPAPQNQISPDQANLADEHLAAGSANGYAFRYRIASPASDADPQYELSATPENYGKSGVHSFLLDADGKMHVADRQGAAASTDDPVVAPENTAAQQPSSGDPGLVAPGSDSNSSIGGNSEGSSSSSAHPPQN